MSGTKYSYNPKTVRYERVGIRWGAISWRILSMATFSLLFFVGLVLISNKFYESDEESRLRIENAALAKHMSIAESEVYDAENMLVSLYEQENELHKKIFLTDKPEVGSSIDRTAEIIKFDLADFKEFTNSLLNKTSISLNNASVRNYEFSKLFWPGQDDIDDVQSYPTITPVKNFTMKSLASGFGNQINPFNKRLYRHNGIDIICEYKTDVVATGKGKVVAAVRSEVPGGKGSYIVIEHANGYKSRYAHLFEIKVTMGQKVAQGQSIGTVGASGSAVAPHLHYEILKEGRVINPVLFFVEDLNETELYQLAMLNNQVKQSLD